MEIYSKTGKYVRSCYLIDEQCFQHCMILLIKILAQVKSVWRVALYSLLDTLFSFAIELVMNSIATENIRQINVEFILRLSYTSNVLFIFEKERNKLSMLFMLAED